MPPFSFILQVLHLQVSHDVFTQSPPRMKRGFTFVYDYLKYSVGDEPITKDPNPH